jgi:hypothetical protein
MKRTAKYGASGKSDTGGGIESGRTIWEVGDKIVARLAQMRRAEVVARFAIGDEVHAVRYGPGFGDHAVRELGQRVGHDASGLLIMARVAERIRPEERSRLLALTDSVGLPLFWSHYATLKDICSRQERLRVARLVLEHRFSTRELQSYLRGRGRLPKSLRLDFAVSTSTGANEIESVAMRRTREVDSFPD